MKFKKHSFIILIISFFVSFCSNNNTKKDVEIVYPEIEVISKTADSTFKALDLGKLWNSGNKAEFNQKLETFENSMDILLKKYPVTLNPVQEGSKEIYTMTQISIDHISAEDRVFIYFRIDYKLHKRTKLFQTCRLELYDSVNDAIITIHVPINETGTSLFRLFPGKEFVSLNKIVVL